MARSAGRLVSCVQPNSTVKSVGILGRPPIGVFGLSLLESCACAFNANARKASVSIFFIKEASFEEDVGKNIKFRRIYAPVGLNYS